MNMIVGKKQIVLASLVAALGVAVYLNYQFAGEDLELVTANTTQQTAVEGALEETQEQEHYGDAQFVQQAGRPERAGGRGIFLAGAADPPKDPRPGAGGIAGDADRHRPDPGTEG